MYGGSRARAGLSSPDGQLRDLVESTGDLLWSVDDKFNLLTFNRAFAVIIERASGGNAVPEMCPERLWPGPAAEVWRERYHRTLTSGAYRTEHDFFDGARYELLFRPIGEEGALTGVAVSGRECATGSAGDRHSKSVLASADGVLIVEEDGTILEANTAYC